jgi:uncharacterized protein (DUF952 family)
MKKIILSAALILNAVAFSTDLDTPTFLYKIVSPNDWTDSQDEPTLVLSEDDEAFIHLSTQDQLDRILNKYWAGSSAIVLKVDVSKLEGDLVYEVNEGGSTKYYHLYNGETRRNRYVETLDFSRSRDLNLIWNE